MDVRGAAEHSSGHAVQTINLPLNRLTNEIENLNPNEPVYVICQGGYRSSVAASVLEKAGFREIYNVSGGTAAWINAGLETQTLADCAV